MKKTGYTLAEVLIALTIIGIIAAVSLPLVNKYAPDIAKIKYLKTYDTLVETIKVMANSTAFYPVGEGGEFGTKPFMNIAKVEVNGTSYGGDNAKFCNILGAFFSDNISSCNKDYVSEYSEDKFTNNFKARNGVEFFVTTKNDDYDYQSDIYFDIDGIDNGKNCLYNKDSCPLPDRFLVQVNANGSIKTTDPVGKYYLDNRINWKKKDYVIAEEEVPVDPFADIPKTICSDLYTDCSCSNNTMIYVLNNKYVNCLTYVGFPDLGLMNVANYKFSPSKNVSFKGYLYKLDSDNEEIRVTKDIEFTLNAGKVTTDPYYEILKSEDFLSSQDYTQNLYFKLTNMSIDEDDRFTYVFTNRWKIE